MSVLTHILAFAAGGILTIIFRMWWDNEMRNL